jgi:hypothetical protein
MRYWWLGLGLVVGCGPAAVEPEVPAPVAVEAEAEPPMEEVVAADGTLLEVPPDLVPYILTPEAKQEIVRQANEVARNAEALEQEASTVEAPPKDCEANTSQDYGEWLAGQLVGTKEGNRVNVRPKPDLNQKDGSYGLVGEAIAVMAQHDDGQCQRWYRVQFPESGWQGWVHGDHVRIDHGSDE